jgi:hypothetical protein
MEKKTLYPLTLTVAAADVENAWRSLQTVLRLQEETGLPRSYRCDTAVDALTLLGLHGYPIGLPFLYILRESGTHLYPAPHSSNVTADGVHYMTHHWVEPTARYFIVEVGALDNKHMPGRGWLAREVTPTEAWDWWSQQQDALTDGADLS